MAGRSEVAALSAMLASVDRHGYPRLTAGLGDTPGPAPVTVVDSRGVDVTLPRCMSCLPDDARLETLARALDRISDPSLPPYGPRAVAFMGTGAYRAERRAWLAHEPGRARSPRDASRLEGAMERLSAMLGPSERMAVDGTGLWWRRPARDMRGGCALTDPASRTVLMDGRLAARSVPGVLVDYAVWRELCCIAAWDAATCAVDRAMRDSLVQRFPEPELSALHSACEVLGWVSSPEAGCSP